MTRPMPDTDPLKREQPGETSKIPSKDTGGGALPPGRPGDRRDESTEDRPGTIQPRGDEPTNRGTPR